MLLRSLTALRFWLDQSARSKDNRRTRRAVSIHVEQLEDRLTPSAGAREQYMLELVNRMRENPAAELPLLVNSTDPNVQSALTFFNVDQSVLQTQWSSLVPTPPLAWNDILGSTALAHDQAMLSAGVQAHQVAGESDLGTRITNAGYTVWSNVGENIFAFAHSVFEAHAAFAIDWGQTSTGIQSPPGHRQNLMSTSFRDIGIGVLDAPNGSSMGPLLITQDFGNRFSYGNPNLLGVVYNDANANGYYDMGEGLGNVTLTITGAGAFTTTTSAFGGYQIPLPAGTYTVVASGGGLIAPISQTVTIGANNVHANFINGSQPPQSAALPFADDFNRADSSYLGTYWTTRQGHVGITNNTLLGGTTVGLATVNGVTLADTTLQANVAVTNVNQQASLVARYISSTKYYLGRVVRTSTGFWAQICKNVNGTMTTLASVPLSSGTGTLRFDVVGSNLKLYFGADAASISLKAFAYDSSISSAGSVGVRTYAGGSMDNFSADAVTVATSQALPFTDVFAANALTQQLTTNWRERAGNFNVAGGTALAAGPSISVATVNGVALANVAVQADVAVGPNQFAALLARYQANGNFYQARLTANSTGTGHTVSIAQMVSGVCKQLSVAPVTVASGAGTLRFEVLGNSLKAFFGPDANHLSLATYVFSGTIAAAGQTGIRGLKNATFANFSVDAISAAAASLPFSDTFTQIDGGQLSRQWTERAGNFTVSGNAIVATSVGAAIATINNAPIADVDILADVVVSAGQVAGLIARYQTSGSFYLAQLNANSTGTSFTVNIYKSIAGVCTLLKSAPVATGAGTLRFVVTGSSLQVYFGADASSLSLALSAVDTSISAAGFAGIRANKNATLDNFTVN